MVEFPGGVGTFVLDSTLTAGKRAAPAAAGLRLAECGAESLPSAGNGQSPPTQLLPWPDGLREIVGPNQPGVDYRTSSVVTVKYDSLAWPNEVVMATSVASMPVPSSTRPMRCALCRASHVHQRSSR